MREGSPASHGASHQGPLQPSLFASSRGPHARGASAVPRGTRHRGTSRPRVSARPGAVSARTGTTYQVRIQPPGGAHHFTPMPRHRRLRSHQGQVSGVSPRSTWNTPSCTRRAACGSRAHQHGRHARAVPMRSRCLRSSCAPRPRRAGRGSQGDAPASMRTGVGAPAAMNTTSSPHRLPAPRLGAGESEPARETRARCRGPACTGPMRSRSCAFLLERGDSAPAARHLHACTPARLGCPRVPRGTRHRAAHHPQDLAAAHPHTSRTMAVRVPRGTRCPPPPSTCPLMHVPAAVRT